MIHADAFGYMRQMALNGKTYGVVVLDPPKLIVDRDDIPAGKRKYFDLNVLAMKLVEAGGLLVTCSCSGLLDAAEFMGLLGAAARNADRQVQLLAMTGAARRPSGRARRPRRRLPQGRLAARRRRIVVAHAHGRGVTSGLVVGDADRGLDLESSYEETCRVLRIS